jgi:hypothetical protein
MEVAYYLLALGAEFSDPPGAVPVYFLNTVKSLAFYTCHQYSLLM